MSVEHPEQASSRQAEPKPAVQRDYSCQLSNAVALASTTNQIVWTVFGIFWAANAVLLVALFTTGDLPHRTPGLVVSAASDHASMCRSIQFRLAVGVCVVSTRESGLTPAWSRRRSIVVCYRGLEPPRLRPKRGASFIWLNSHFNREN